MTPVAIESVWARRGARRASVLCIDIYVAKGVFLGQDYDCSIRKAGGPESPRTANPCLSFAVPNPDSSSSTRHRARHKKKRFWVPEINAITRDRINPAVITHVLRTLPGVRGVTDIAKVKAYIT